MPAAPGHLVHSNRRNPRQVRLPSAHGTRSTLIPHVGHATRRIAYTKYTRMPQKGMNSNRRDPSRSYPARLAPHPEQTARLFLRGSTVMFNTNCSFSWVNSMSVYTNPWCFWTRLSILLTCIPAPSWLTTVRQKQSINQIRSRDASTKSTHKAILWSLELRRFGVGPHPKRAGDEPAEWKGLPWALPRQAEGLLPPNPPTNQSREPRIKVRATRRSSHG